MSTMKHVAGHVMVTAYVLKNVLFLFARMIIILAFLFFFLTQPSH
jgi:hypothetical protein